MLSIPTTYDTKLFRFRIDQIIMLILMGEIILSFVVYSNDVVVVVVVVVVGSLAGYCCSYGFFTVAECLTLEVMVVVFIYICFIRKVKFKTA